MSDRQREWRGRGARGWRRGLAVTAQRDAANGEAAHANQQEQPGADVKIAHGAIRQAGGEETQCDECGEAIDGEQNVVQHRVTCSCVVGCAV